METRIYKQKYRYKGEQKDVATYTIEFFDHIELKRSVPASTGDEEQAKKYADNIDELVQYRKMDRVPKTLAKWITTLMPLKMKTKLLKWDILDRDLFGEKEKPVITPLTEYLEKYKKKLVLGFKPKLPGMMNSGRHVDETHSMVRRIIAGCKFTVWGDIRFDTVGDYIRTLGLKAKTFNDYCKNFEQFVKFVIEKDFEHTHPRGGKIARFQVEYRPIRRALSPDEVAKLIASTYAAEDEAFGMTGRQRAIMYLTAAESGYRAGELSRLTVEDFDLVNASINLDNTRTKNRRYAEQPIKQRRVLQYRWFFTGMKPSDKAFSFWKTPRTADCIRQDLEAAGVKIKNSKGIPADFHSLRKTFCTQIDRLDLSEAEKDRLSRHSNMGSLRKSRYTDTDDGRIRAAIDGLPFEWPVIEVEEDGKHEDQASKKVG